MSRSWESDPALRALRDEFIESFGERLQELAGATEPEALREIAHKAAGIAGSYGFAAVSRIAGRLDDLLSAPLAPETRARLPVFTALMGDCFRHALANREDPVELEQDPRCRELISCVESLPSEARSGSS